MEGNNPWEFDVHEKITLEDRESAYRKIKSSDEPRMISTINELVCKRVLKEPILDNTKDNNSLYDVKCVKIIELWSFYELQQLS